MANGDDARFRGFASSLGYQVGTEATAWFLSASREIINRCFTAALQQKRDLIFVEICRAEGSRERQNHRGRGLPSRTEVQLELIYLIVCAR